MPRFNVTGEPVAPFSLVAFDLEARSGGHVTQSRLGVALDPTTIMCTGLHPQA
jgi:hypothetical protein